jgi:hypothetical protein
MATWLVEMKQVLTSRAATPLTGTLNGDTRCSKNPAAGKHALLSALRTGVYLAQAAGGMVQIGIVQPKL